MPSVSPRKIRESAAIRMLVVVACLGLLTAGATGCSTTQEKAAAKKVESEHILKAREVEEKAEAKKKREHAKAKGKGKANSKSKEGE